MFTLLYVKKIVNDLSLQVYYCATDALGKKEEVEEIQFSLRKQSFSLQNILVSAASTYLAQEYPSLLESQLKKTHLLVLYMFRL